MAAVFTDESSGWSLACEIQRGMALVYQGWSSASPDLYYKRNPLFSDWFYFKKGVCCYNFLCCLYHNFCFGELCELKSGLEASISVSSWGPHLKVFWQNLLTRLCPWNVSLRDPVMHQWKMSQPVNTQMKYYLCLHCQPDDPTTRITFPSSHVTCILSTVSNFIWPFSFINTWGVVLVLLTSIQIQVNVSSQCIHLSY